VRQAITHALPLRVEMRAFMRVMRHRSEQFDIIHLHGVFWPPLLALADAAAAALGKWLVVKITGEAERDWALLEGHAGTLAALQRAAAVVTLIPETQRFFEKRLPDVRVELIPNGVPLPSLGASRSSMNQATVLYVGTLKREKGLDVLLRAWVRVPERARLVIAGDGPERAPLEKLAAELGVGTRVDFLGMRSDVPDLMRAAEVFVLPSRSEGMSNALLEAMSFALPCIATRIPGSADLLQDKVSGLLVPSEQEDAMAGAIAEVLVNRELAARLGTEARADVEASHSIGPIARRHQALYRETIEMGK
jgi:glycosyltransferase involved in cell wall biosynthesis